MRKKITCRIIKSVPLNEDGEFSHHKTVYDTEYDTEFDSKTFTYTNCRKMVETSNDNQTSRILDLYI